MNEHKHKQDRRYKTAPIKTIISIRQVFVKYSPRRSLENKYSQVFASIHKYSPSIRQI